MDSAEVLSEGVTWRVILRLMPDHAHHITIERDGHVAVEHVGSLPEGWPGVAFPLDVHGAVALVAEHLSWP